MEKLIEAVEELTPSNCMDTFDKIVNQSSSKNPFSPKVNLGWILLAKILRNLNEETLKGFTQRVQKRLSDVVKVRVCDGTIIFVHTAVNLFPTVINNNQKLLKCIATLFIEHAFLINQETCNDYIADLISEIFLLVTKFSAPNSLLISITEIVNGDVNDTRDVGDEFLKFPPILNEGKRNFFVAQLLKLYTLNVMKSNAMVEINFNLFIKIADSLKRFEDNDIKKEIFNCLKCLSIRCGHLVLPYISDILNLVSSYENDPDVLEIDTFFCDTFGTASTLYRTFHFTLTKVLDSKNEVNLVDDIHTCRLLASILKTCGYLLTPVNISQLLKKLLLDLVKSCKVSTESLLLLNAFLSLNHEGVPVPVNVAQKILWEKKFDNKQRVDFEFKTALENCRTLCSVITRPKIVGVGAVKIDVNQICNSNGIINNDLEVKIEPEEIDRDVNGGLDDEGVDDDDEYLAMKRQWEENTAILKLKRKALDEASTQNESKGVTKRVRFEEKETEPPKAEKNKKENKKKVVRPKSAFMTVIKNKDETAKSIDEMLADFCPE
uniref:NUC173 domain-containing protein n=1 Tax=Strongyloides papillosus TaxID=174720 RepID=A0A0N5CEJ0_STREA